MGGREDAVAPRSFPGFGSQGLGLVALPAVGPGPAGGTAALESRQTVCEAEMQVPAA